MSAPATSPVEIFESGDAALRVVAVSDDGERNWSTVHRLAGWLDGCGADGLHGAVPTYDSVLVEFDPLLASARQIKAFVQLGLRQLGTMSDEEAPREFHVPVVYGGSYGPDLKAVAEYQGISADDVIRLHSGKTYVVRCLGAPAGSPMMDGPEFPRPGPRLKDPASAFQPGRFPWQAARP
jgi:allophanate hydrolase subunit 1